MKTIIGIEELKSRLDLLIGKPVWRTKFSSRATALIDFGERVPRKRTNKSRVSPEMGELTLMIWCAWRLEIEGTGIVCGSGDLDEETLRSNLSRLIGETVAEISLNSFLDLLVVFGSGMRMRLFCDLRTDDPETEYCYTLLIRQPPEAIIVGNNVVMLEAGEG